MIRLNIAANIGGTIRPAGAHVSGLGPDRERVFVDAGSATYPSKAEIAEAEVAKNVRSSIRNLLNKELDAMAKKIGIDTTKLKHDDKVTLIESEIARMDAETQLEADVEPTEVTDTKIGRSGKPADSA